MSDQPTVFVVWSVSVQTGDTTSATGDACVSCQLRYVYVCMQVSRNCTCDIRVILAYIHLSVTQTALVTHVWHLHTNIWVWRKWHLWHTCHSYMYVCKCHTYMYVCKCHTYTYVSRVTSGTSLGAWVRRGCTRFQIPSIWCLKHKSFPPTIGIFGSRLPNRKLKICTSCLNFVIIQMRICPNPPTHVLPTRRVHWRHLWHLHTYIYTRKHP